MTATRMHDSTYLIIHFHIFHISNITIHFSVNLSYEFLTLSPWQHHSNVDIFQETRSWCQEGLKSTDKDLIPWTVHMEQIWFWPVSLIANRRASRTLSRFFVWRTFHAIDWFKLRYMGVCPLAPGDGAGLCVKCNSEPMALSAEINNFKFMSGDLITWFSEYLLSLAVWRAWKKAWSKWGDVLGSFKSHSRLIEVKFVADDLLFYELYWQYSLQWAGLLIRGDAEEEEGMCWPDVINMFVVCILRCGVGRLL